MTTSNSTITMAQLEAALAVSWDAATAKGGWNPVCPCLNQCAVTALVVQDWFGGDLLRCPTKEGDSHYWNRLPNGHEVGLTDGQFVFSGNRPLYDQIVEQAREYVLSFPDTLAKYTILSQRVTDILGKPPKYQLW